MDNLPDIGKGIGQMNASSLFVSTCNKLINFFLLST